MTKLVTFFLLFAVNIKALAETTQPFVIELSPSSEPKPPRQSEYAQHQMCLNNLGTLQFCLNQERISGKCKSDPKPLFVWTERTHHDYADIYTLTNKGLSVNRFPLVKNRYGTVQSFLVKIPTDLPDGSLLKINVINVKFGFWADGINYSRLPPNDSELTEATLIETNKVMPYADGNKAIARLVAWRLQDQFDWVRDKNNGQIPEKLKETLCSCLLSDPEVLKVIEKFNIFKWSKSQCLTS